MVSSKGWGSTWCVLGFDSVSRFVRYAKARPRPWFACLPNRDGYNKRLRRSGAPDAIDSPLLGGD
ncbi:MAG: hypothetical protein OXH78_07775 [Acidimicrobiaceae bacterium]|nr:hypothetical protein [Acidimicrobiaceae bacterium]